MKQRPGIRPLLICMMLSISCGAGAHPEDSPLTFIPHRNDNGAIIFTNIPKKCFRNGVLLCTRYHPMFAHGQAMKKPAQE